MQKLVETGKVRNIGVSNFEQENLEKLFASPDFKITPAVNQIELHPCHPSPKLVKYCHDKSISVTAYSCLGSTDSPLYKNETLAKLAKSKGKSVQQVLLMWGLQRGTSVIPKSVSQKRIEANFELDDFELSAEDMKVLDSLPERFKVCGQDW